MGCRGRLALVTREVEEAIAGAGLPLGFADLLRFSLMGESGILSSHPSGRWALLTTASCEAASGGEWEQAIPAAAAVEVIAAAFELLDDLQDGDPNVVVARSGPAQALNVSIGLVLLAQRLLLHLGDHGVNPETTLDVSREFSRGVTEAGGGQYLDLLGEAGGLPTEDEVLDLSARKSGALVSAACRIGARLGSTDTAIIDLLGQFGSYAGTAAQLLNDLASVLPGGPTKSDVRRHKKTLPLVAAVTFGLASARLDALAQDEEALREELARSGASHYVWVVADVYRRRATELLTRLGPRHPTDNLLGLLPRG